LPVKTKI
jgi:hypothetical protein